MKKLLTIVVLVFCAMLKPLSTKAQDAAWTVTIKAEAKPTNYGNVSIQGGYWKRNSELWGVYYELEWKWNPNWSTLGATSSETTEERFEENLGGYFGNVEGHAKFKLKAEPTNPDLYYFVGWSKTDNPSSDADFLGWKAETGEQQESDFLRKNRIVNYYAIFRHYVYGHNQTQSAEAQPAEWGEISIDKGETYKTSDSKTSTSYATKKQGETIQFEYRARAKSDVSNVYFIGWYDDKGTLVSEISNFTYSFTPTSEDLSKPSTVPHLIAKFGRKAVYHDYATAEVVLVDADGNYQPIDDQSFLNGVGGVYIGTSAPNADAYLPAAEYGSGNVLTIGESSGYFSYTYHAQEKDGYHFLGWSITQPVAGQEIDFLKKDEEIIRSSPYVHEFYTNIVDESNPPTPECLYAVFQRNTYYYHTGAKAGFATNGEKGKIVVTGTVYDKEDGTANSNYRKETTDADINDPDGYRVEPINNNLYTFTYEAIDTDLDGQDKSVFKGWSRSALGDVIYSTENPLEYEHITFQTSSTGQPDDPTMLYAVFRSYWYSDPTVMLTTSSRGTGQVAALYTDDVLSAPADGDWKDEIRPTQGATPHQVPALPEYDLEGYKYQICYWAKPKFGNNFIGWADADNPNSIVYGDQYNPLKVEYATKKIDDEDPFVPARWYAVFKSVIEVIQKDRMIYYVDEHGNKNINDANIIINFNKTDVLRAELIEDDLNANLFELSDKQRVSFGKQVDLDASQGIIQLVLSYKGTTPKEHVGRTANIRLSASYEDENHTLGTVELLVSVTIEEKPTVTFLHTDGLGAYTIKHTDGRGISYLMPIDATKHIYVPIAQENMATFELNSTETKEGYAFSGWEMITPDGTEIISKDNKCTYSFLQSAAIRPVFTEVRNDIASFSILTCDGIGQDPDAYYKNPQKSYYDLHEALAVAKERVEKGLGNQVVVFSNDGKVSGVLPQGDYTIPTGVTLLIPGVGPTPITISGKVDAFLMELDADKVIVDRQTKNKYVYRVKRQATINEVSMPAVLTVDDYGTTSISTGGKNPQCYRKLIVEDNTTITVEPGGSINMYAYIVADESQEAKPLRYGWIELGENAKIILQETTAEKTSAAELFAHGYITGPQSSGVIAQGGANVYELMQYCEHRGGQGIAHLYLQKDSYHTFPIHQYYIQNIEVPLELHYGATEYVTTAAYVMNTQFVMMADFIGSQSGFLRIGENTTFIKSYDAQNDRLKMYLRGNGSTATVGSMNIRMGSMVDAVKTAAGSLGSLIPDWMLSSLSDVSLNSADYVMPINNNIDLILQNVVCTAEYDLSFMAGSTMSVDESSSFVITNNAEVFIYDANENLLPAAERGSATFDQYGTGYGYYASTNKALAPLPFTPNNSQKIGTTNKRTAATVLDAKWVVDGIVQIETGGLYTTEGKAQIISNNKGRVKFNKSVSSTTTYQAKYLGGSSTSFLSENGTHKRMSYSAHSAQLKNAAKDANGNDTYVDTRNTTGTYSYNPVKGIWEQTDAVTDNLIGANIRVTMPDYNISSEDVIDPFVTEVASNVTVSDPQISWDGGSTYTPTTARGPVDKLYYTTLSYTPTNKAGEYDGLIKIGGGTHYQRVIVTEDYTPEFVVPKAYQMNAYLGQSLPIPANIEVESTNVASILSGRFASAVSWTYAITGDNADEFTFAFGSGADKLSTAEITFTPKTSNTKNAVLSLNCTYTDGAGIKHSTTVAVPLVGYVATLAPNPLAFAEGIDSIFVGASETKLFEQVANGNTKPIDIKVTKDGVITEEYLTVDNAGMETTIKPEKIGSVTITATQEADTDYGVAATSISKTIYITDNIVWNWENLYFGSENVNPITTLYTDWNLEVTDNRLNVIREFNSLSAEEGYYQVILESWPDGEAEPVFTMTYNDGTEEKTQEFISHVTRDPRQLSVYVNEKRVYDAVTLNVSRIDHIASNLGDDYYVQFKSTADEIAQWTFYFMGIPDKLSFNASGSNNWQIEESANGTNWTIAYTWAPISSSTEFELSLQPSTNYVRISYGTSSTPSMGVLSKIAVTELVSVKTDVEKLYMPDPSSQKNVVFTYVSETDLPLITNNAVFTTSPEKLDGSTLSPFYQIKRVAVNSEATTEIKDGMLSVSSSSAAVPIRTYAYPQALPIQLASDELERYYFVTSESYNTSWSNDEATRTIVMRNAVADASPYIVFHFADAPAPGVISFNYAGISDGASWTVQESDNGTVWYDLEVDTENEKAGLVMRKFSPTRTALYARVIYNSDYAGIVEITNMAILPTTSVVVNPAQLTVFSNKDEELSIIASNLVDVQFTFTPSDAFAIQKVMDKNGSEQDGIGYFTGDGAHNGKILISYKSAAAVTYGKLEITTDNKTKVLATVDLTGVNRYLPAGVTGIKTGTDLQIINFNKNEGDEGYLRDVNTEHAFEITRNPEGEITATTPLFDYVIIYGETKTTDGSGTITAPSSVTGSNAQTPCYIYQKTKVDDTYKYQITEDGLVENANSSRKSWRGAISIADNDASTVDGEPENLRVYITGFCPYASTGYTQSDEGVWYFEGDAGDKIDVYLEDCYIYSRYKSKRGNAFTRESGESYSGMVARGSGAVLLFASKTQKEGLTTPLEVTIHSRGSNLLKSHYGCLFSSFVGRAFQISAPIHIYMQSENHYRNSHTELNFTDEWPTAAAVDNKGQFTTTERTNGFLSLRKQVNNAPSIDMGNANTVVNFRGGQVELENARISSDNYESTLAISYRTGVYGPAKFRFVLSYGIGTDGVDGRVNFYDGTTTVRPMEVETRFQQYYLMDDNGKTTSCLRLPKNTFVYGGSHCMMRACEAPTSKGGAPTDGDVEWREEYDEEKGQNILKPYITGNPLGLYQYKDGWNTNGIYGLVKPTNFPGTLQKSDGTTLESIHDDYPEDCYGVSSITPNKDGVLNLWIPAGFGKGKQPEVDQKISFWKASMTLIEANYGVYSGSVGGDFSIETKDDKQTEQVQNLLYCQIDNNISDVISAKGDKQYVAPVLNPAPDGGYISIAPTNVGEDLQHYIGNEEPYQVENKVYYVTTIPQADVWINFTAPFNVEKIYVVETYDEDFLSKLGTRDYIMEEQAKHNADFAAFFGVAIALESKKTFDLIYKDYLGWVKEVDKTTDKRGMQLLEQYYETYNEGKYVGSNWKTADYYLYKNTGDWEITTDDEDNQRFITQWEFVAPPAEGQALLKQGETYSMLFPYCTGCDVEKDANGQALKDANGYPIIAQREYWDYWSGKFIIFESTKGPHTIQGSAFVGEEDPDTEKTGDWVFDGGVGQGEAKLMGNSTFAQMMPKNEDNINNIYVYTAEAMREDYMPIFVEDENIISPTSTFLYGDFKRNNIRPRISREGNITYGNGTSGLVPTVGGGKDMFITAIEGGINIAVAEPQMVKVISSTGAVLFAGYVTTATDVQLPTHGIYIVSGENEVQKILH